MQNAAGLTPQRSALRLLYVAEFPWNSSEAKA
jgi:hypothetical protein